MARRAFDAHIIYLLDGAPLFGGVKVVLDQANLMAARGYDVTVRCTEPRPDWMDVAFRWDETVDLAYLEHSSGPGEEADHEAIVIGTYWTTLGAAAVLGGRRAVHYCQGYEGLYSHNKTDHPAIREAYSLPMPALTVSPHLNGLLAREFGRRAEVVKQPLSTGFSPCRGSVNSGLSGSRTPRVLVMSPIEVDWKGVETGLRALVKLRDRDVDFDLVRISQFEQSELERGFDLGGEYHCRVRPERVQEIMRNCDLLLAPSWEPEGFGLPVLEAMASGVPVVASDVSCFRAWCGGAALLVPPKEPDLWANTVQRVLQHSDERLALRRQGLGLAGSYQPADSVRSLEQALCTLLDLGSS